VWGLVVVATPGDCEAAAMGKLAHKRDLDREICYWGFIADDVGTVDACRQVVVIRKTG